MLATMKISSRIWFGFGAILGILLILGGIAIVSMRNVEVNGNKLAHEYVPEVAVADSSQIILRTNPPIS